MVKQLKLTCNKTYATEKNAVKAVEDFAPPSWKDLTYIVMRSEDGRFFPVFIGERAIQAMVHFKFNVVA